MPHETPDHSSMAKTGFDTWTSERKYPDDSWAAAPMFDLFEHQYGFTVLEPYINLRFSLDGTYANTLPDIATIHQT